MHVILFKLFLKFIVDIFRAFNYPDMPFVIASDFSCGKKTALSIVSFIKFASFVLLQNNEGFAESIKDIYRKALNQQVIMGVESTGMMYQHLQFYG